MIWTCSVFPGEGLRNNQTDVIKLKFILSLTLSEQVVCDLAETFLGVAIFKVEYIFGWKHTNLLNVQVLEQNLIEYHLVIEIGFREKFSSMDLRENNVK